MIQIGDLQKPEQLPTGHTYGYQAIVLDYFRRYPNGEKARRIVSFFETEFLLFSCC